jgi:glucose-6-phosphate isomerase
MINKLRFNCEFDKNITQELAQEKQNIGYYDLPYQDTNYVENYLNKLDLENIKKVVIVGIGGSSLGIRAIYHFIKAGKNLPRKMYFMGSTDPLSIDNTLKKIDIEKAHFIVISKSGTTIETIATYKYLLDFIPKNQFSFITDKNSKLDKYANSNNQIVAHIQPNIGGRFSALSTVGILPLALIGINYQELLNGAKKTSDDFWSGKNENILQKAYFYAKNQPTYHINTIFSYSDSLNYFNQWFVQLWGESLGKKQINSTLNVGATPIGLIGPKDQHSFLQLLAQGTRDKTLTFITTTGFSNDKKVPNISLKNLENLDIFNGISFAELISKQAESTLKSLENIERLPIDEIVLRDQNEKTIGELIFYYQLLTSLVGKLLNVNTYDQPGVELGKQILEQNIKNDK